MFVISRKVGESIVIVPAGATANSSSIEIRIEEVSGERVKLAIDAPMFFRILRRPERSSIPGSGDVVRTAADGLG